MQRLAKNLALTLATGGLPLLAGLAGLAADQPQKPAPLPPPAAKQVEFERDIRPLLTTRCVACHGPQRQQNGLRLDLKASALEGGDSGPLFTAGKSAESELVQRLASPDPKKVMPPGKPLTAEQIGLVRAWIDQGGKWPDDPRGVAAAPRSSHWAFQPVKPVALPPVRLKGWPINPIDRFILAKLEAKGLRPSPPADRVTLIRRLSLDLLGLPPTPEEVDQFVNDTQPGAYERLVDRLLASPHYGERWARFWLDGARYADSNGYTIDSARSIWMYRDWVIDAFNRDMPFDQFTIEQLAGDLLPNATQSQIVATGFHRNTMVNEEGGTDPEQFRIEAVYDRVATTGSVWLGLTLGCAQCHTHKYDPITQKEYYQFFSFFNNQDEPALPLPNPEQAKKQSELQAKIRAAQARLAEYDRSSGVRQAEWERRLLGGAGVDWEPLQPADLRSAQGARLTAQRDGSVLVDGTQLPDQDTYTVTGKTPLPGATAVRLEVLTHDSLPNGGPGFASGNFLLSEIEVTVDGRRVPVSAATADHSQNGYPVANAVDGDPRTAWAINVPPGQGKLNTDRTAVFTLKPSEPISAGATVAVALRQEHRNKRYLIGRFRLSVTAAAPEAAVTLVPTAVREVVRIPAASRTKQQNELLQAEFQKGDVERARLAAEVMKAQDEEKALTRSMVTTLVLRERQQPRQSFMHIRGDFLRKGPQVQPGVPAALPALTAGAGQPNRLDLARWLVDPKNPLTPRVTVNRVWQWHFGTGLVETENDFGTQGSPPTHPELLDWLAGWFAESGTAGKQYGSVGAREYGSRNPPNAQGLTPNALPHTPTRPHPHTGSPNAARPTPNAAPPGANWSLKQLHRLIVTSATYRQSSKARRDLEAVDPQNRLLTRQHRLRVEAEAIRDLALAASGLLSPKIGGPSVFPPQPAGLELFTQSKKNWKVSEGEDRYRRGLYTFIWRSNPYPMFTTFDAPSGQVTCTRRVRSNTPLGALMLANDQSMIEMAQALASRTLREAPATEEARLRYAFRRCLSREPSPLEARRLMEYYRAQVTAFQADPAEAEKTAPKERGEGTDAAHAAAWTAVARVLTNLDEFITRE